MIASRIGRLALAALAALPLSAAHAATQMQAVTLNVPISISWPDSDAAQAFSDGAPQVTCNIYNFKIGNPTFLPGEKPLATATEPLLVDSSGKYSKTVSLTFSVPAGQLAPQGGWGYWCYLARHNSKNYCELSKYAQGRGLKVTTDDCQQWGNSNTH
jgi:hypothetical protein